MSTEPTEPGPDQQEPVDLAPGAERTSRPDPAPQADGAGGDGPSGEEQESGRASGQQPEGDGEAASSVAGAVVGALGSLAKDVVAGAAQAVLGHKEPGGSGGDDQEQGQEGSEAPPTGGGTDEAPAAQRSPDEPSADPSSPDEPSAGPSNPDEPSVDPSSPDEPSADRSGSNDAQPGASSSDEPGGQAEAAATPATEPAATAPAAGPEAVVQADASSSDEPGSQVEAAATPAATGQEPSPTPGPDPGSPIPTGAAPSPASVPTPAAVPRPAKGPRAATPVTPAAATPPLAVGAAAFGRVDDSGTVHVRDGEEEREVGQYPDVPADEALAFYVRKFEDLAAQVHLLGQRLDNGTVPAKEARSSLGTLHKAVAEANVVGDLPALRAELARLDGLVAERTAAEDAQRQQARAEALAQREAIVVEAEQIAATPAESMHFKSAGERMAALLDSWKTAQRSGTRLDKRTEDPLWKRFAAARSTVDRLRRAHFAQVSEQRSSTKAEKEQLIARAEELQTSTDWRGTSEEYRTLMDRWKSSGRLARKDDDALWARFRAAQDVFFAARTAANAAEDEEYKANLAVKEALLLEAEALLPVTDPAGARRKLASIQDRWDAAGKVPRGDIDRIETRLRTVIEKVRDAEGAKWGKGKPDVVARGSGLVEQLRQQVADLDAKAAEAEARGDSRTAQRAAKERATKQAWLDQAEASLSDLSR